MKQFTEVFGTMEITASIPNNEVTHEIRIEPKKTLAVFPVLPTMSRKQIVTMLTNSKALRDRDVIHMRGLIESTISNIRTAILEALQEEESLIVDDNYISHFLPDALQVSNIGRSDSIENGAFILPKSTMVKIVNTVFPIPFEDTPRDLCIVDDYIAQV